MVLDKLGDSLKNTLKKVAGSLFIDEKLINELVKDLQRALLQGDVNVQLVFDLSKSIKKRALEEKPPKGISQKEHLINIVYEELVKFLGKEKAEIRIEKKKPFKIMMVGLFGSGKCVHKDSKIILSDGSVSSAEEIYNSYKENEDRIEDGYIINVEDKNLFVPSFNPRILKLENKKVTRLWKLNGKNLLQVHLDNGNDFNVRVTPEHPFFVLRNGRVQKVRADELTEDDFVATPSNYKLNCERRNLFLDLKNLNLDTKNYYLDLSQINIRNGLVPKLKFPRNYCQLTADLNQGITPIQFVKNYSENITIRKRGSHHFISFPIILTEELAEFLGYVIGDGHLGGQYIDIANEDEEIINRITYLSNKLFDFKAKVKKDKRTRAMYRIIIGSKTLVEILNKIFNIPIGKKGTNLRVPRVIMKSDEAIASRFLRAYFDCDASAVKNSRGIELSSQSHPLIVDIAYLLNRFGIISSISKKYVNNIPYWRLGIKARYAEMYSSKIGFIVKHKKDRAEEYALIGKIQGCGKQDMIPLGDSLKKLRLSLGFSIGEIQEYVSSYGIYEDKGRISKESLAGVIALYLLKKRGNIALILDCINRKEKYYSNAFINGFTTLLKKEGFVEEVNDQLMLTDNALQYQITLGKEQGLFELFKSLVSSDVCWLRVNKIENISHAEFVYDLTVEDNHSFIADNIIVHNTTTIGKIAKYYTKRGYKVASLGLDVHRPAAPEQLRQVSEQAGIPCYIEKKEKDPIKIYKKYENQFSKYDILIIDTAGRDALSKDLIEEIELLNKKVQPDENLLVMSADIGQAAQKQAEQFHKSCKITGVVVTKMDGTAKGGGALSACAVTKAPIKFIGVGEKIDDLEEFNPKGFVGRLLGMGDIEALLAKAKEAISEEDAKDLGKKFLKGEYNFLDLYEQMQAVKKMGPLTKIMDLVPGAGSLNIPKDVLNVQDEKLKKWKFIFQSCTKQELEDPDIITRERIDRISKGSGIATSEVRELLKMYKQSKKLMRMMGGMVGKEGEEQDINKLMRKFKGKIPKGLGKLKGMRKMKF